MDTSGNGSISVIDENGFAGGSGTLTVTNWQVIAPTGFDHVSGWLHPNTLVASPNPTPTPDENLLRAVATVIAKDNYHNDIANVWAVGHTQLQNGIHQALVEH